MPGLTGLAVIGVVTSVVGAYYYLRIVKVMYFDEPAEPFDELSYPGVSGVTVVTAVLILLFIVIPGPVVTAAGVPRPPSYGEHGQPGFRIRHLESATSTSDLVREAAGRASPRACGSSRPADGGRGRHGRSGIRRPATSTALCCCGRPAA